MSSMDNLKNAFAGESQANRRYLAFAKKAEEEGHKQVAKLFRAAAEAETVHAHAHLRVMGGVKGTKENIQEAIGGETFEFTKMYPQMIEEAKKEGNKQALQSFEFANKVEKIHAELYQKALNNLGKNEAPDKSPNGHKAKTMSIKISKIHIFHKGTPSSPLGRGQGWVSFPVPRF